MIPLQIVGQYEAKIPDWARPIETITISATAGNVETTKSPDAGKIWKLVSAIITLVCDATVANRTIFFVTEDGSGNEVEVIGRGSTNITASQTKAVGFGQMRNPDYNWDPTNPNFAVIGYSAIDKLLLYDSELLRIKINAGVAGDSYSGYIRYQEVDLND